MVAIKPGDTDLHELILAGSNETASCVGLVIMDQVTSVVNLVQHTTKNYFEQVRSVLLTNFRASTHYYDLRYICNFQRAYRC